MLSEVWAARKRGPYSGRRDTAPSKAQATHARPNAASFALSQSFAAGTSAFFCSNQYTFIKFTLPRLRTRGQEAEAGCWHM